MKYNLEYIKNYIFDYDIGVPTTVIIAIVLIVWCILIVLYRFKINNTLFIRQASFYLFCGYFFFVLCTTIFYREETFTKRYHLQPLWSYAKLYQEQLAQIFLNILLFIPIGFFSCGALKKKSMFYAIGIGFVLSFFIELTQLITTRGVFNVDDIIHNVLGCIIGYLCFKFCYKIIQRTATCYSSDPDENLH
ncbi:MAG: VanZ family protein [Bacteroidaceae bacterium]|nr:VanZ family protein [Bacteroidaceae bacterium]